MHGKGIGPQGLGASKNNGYTIGKAMLANNKEHKCSCGAGEGSPLHKTAAWTRKEGKDPKGGLNAKGVASYRRENPGSKLQAAVTTKPSKLDPDSKDAKRRKSFCARSAGQMKKFPKAAKNPNSRLRQARKRWKC